MKTSKLENSGFEGSALGLGCKRLRFGYPANLLARVGK